MKIEIVEIDIMCESGIPSSNNVMKNIEKGFQKVLKKEGYNNININWEN